MNGTIQDLKQAPVDSARTWSLAASLSSIISAFVASICCVGPLVFALLGIGGAGLLVNFEPYRPYFMVATFGLLGMGFHFTYRKRKGATTGGAECACPVPNTNRAGKIMLWVATVLVIGFLAFPYLAAVLF